MGAATNYLEQRLLDAVFVGTPYTSPLQIRCALTTTVPDDAGAATEVTGGSYARQTVTFSSSTQNASGDAVTANSADVVFSNMPACTVAGVVLYDNIGNPLYAGPLTTAAGAATTVTVQAGGSFRFAAGSLAPSLG